MYLPQIGYVAMMCGLGKKCNELLTDIFNRGTMNWIWPHFPSVTMSYPRAAKADEVQSSGRKLSLNYVCQRQKLLRSSVLTRRLSPFFCMWRRDDSPEQEWRRDPQGEPGSCPLAWEPGTRAAAGTSRSHLCGVSHPEQSRRSRPNAGGPGFSSAFIPVTSVFQMSSRRHLSEPILNSVEMSGLFLRKEVY